MARRARSRVRVSSDSADTQEISAAQARDVLTGLGYEALGEFGIPRRRFFRRNAALGARTHQVYAFPGGHDEIERMLRFRDYLRSNPAVAREYGALKRDLAVRYDNDVEGYAESKAGFVARVLREARDSPS